MASIRHDAEGTVGRGLSPAIWQNYGFLVQGHDPSYRPMLFEDFEKFPTMASATEEDGFITYQDTGVTIKPAAAIDNSEGEFGVVEIAGNDADNDEGHLELGGGVQGLVRIDPTAGEKAVVAFEARIKRDSVTDNHTAFAVGLAEPGIAAANAQVDDTGALVAKDFIGFQTLTASNEEVDAVYNIASGTLAQVKDNAGTAVADTWMKLGCVYDPNGETDKKLRFFIDGAEIAYGTSVTDAIIAAGTAFPTDEELTLVLLTKNGDAGTTEHKVFIDWWAIGAYPVEV